MALLDLLNFVTNGLWGTGKGAPLTAAEFDANTYSLADAIQELIDNPVAGVSVSNIAIVGRQVTFYMSDSSTFGPFDLPIAQPRYRGEWVSETAYSAFDIIKVDGLGNYIVAQDHVSDVGFSSDASNSDGELYIQIAESFPSANTVQVNASTYEPTSAENNSFFDCVDAGGTDFILPVDFSYTGLLMIRQGTAAPVTLSASSDCPISIKAGYYAQTEQEGAVIFAKYLGYQWAVWGDLAPST